MTVQHLNLIHPMHPDAIRLRQQQLLIRSTELRISLSNDLQRLQRPAAWLDQLSAASHWLTQHPLWAVGSLVAWLVLQPRRVVGLIGRAWWLWSTAKRLRRWLAPHFFDHKPAWLLGLRQLDTLFTGQ